MFIAKLIGKVSGHVISHDFESKKAAIDWICGPGLADFKDQTVRGEVWSGDQLAWMRSDLTDAKLFGRG
jgi:hypothetical protein